jgi:hypothetical protein
MRLEGVREGVIERRWKRGEAQKSSPNWDFQLCESWAGDRARGSKRGLFFLPSFGRFLLLGVFMGEMFVALVFVVCNGLLPAAKVLGVLCSMKAGLLSFSGA